MNKWIEELDRRGTEVWKVARKERVDGPLLQLQPPAAWLASLDDKIPREFHLRS